MAGRVPAVLDDELTNRDHDWSDAVRADQVQWSPDTNQERLERQELAANIARVDQLLSDIGLYREANVVIRLYGDYLTYCEAWHVAVDEASRLTQQVKRKDDIIARLRKTNRDLLRIARERPHAD